jgi:hypothetical protein
MYVIYSLSNIFMYIYMYAYIYMINNNHTYIYVIFKISCAQMCVGGVTRKPRGCWQCALSPVSFAAALLALQCSVTACDTARQRLVPLYFRFTVVLLALYWFTGAWRSGVGRGSSM